LRDVPVDELALFLTSRSGLPGPRGNLELADAFASIADRSTILRFVELDDEYLRFCGSEAIGRLIVEEPDDASVCALIRHRATDDLWRVREGAARALQIVGEADRARLRTIVAEWVGGVSRSVGRCTARRRCLRLAPDLDLHVSTSDLLPSARRLKPRSISRSMTNPMGSTTCHMTESRSG